MTRNRKILLAVTVLILALLVCGISFQSSIVAAYHSWRMNAEYSTLFGNPQPNGNGLASHDVTGVDVDAVMERYEFHRQCLVDSGDLTLLTGTFPWLVSEGSIESSDARSNFSERMWKEFPLHRHYYLAPDGSFSTWVSNDDALRWQEFIDAESKQQQQ